MLYRNLCFKQFYDNFCIFHNSSIEHTCIENYDIDKDGKLSKFEAAKVTTLGILFYKNANITTLEDFKYFTNINNLNNAFSYCYNLTDAIFWEGVEYLRDNAIAFCQKIKYIEFPSTIKHLGQMFLRYPIDKNNGIVVCKALNPPVIQSYSTNIKATVLYVPDESLELYKNAEHIKKYISTNIKPLSEYHENI